MKGVISLKIANKLYKYQPTNKNCLEDFIKLIGFAAQMSEKYLNFDFFDIIDIIF